MDNKQPQVFLPYDPRKHFTPLHQRTKRWACLVCHRRAGKTVACVNELVIRALYCKKADPRYAYIAPYYRQAKDVAWVYLKRAVEGFAVQIRESSLRVELPNGAWITLYGADNPDALRGLYLDGAVLDEYGDSRPSLWAEVVLPTLADRKGWAIFIGTPKGKNHFYQIYLKSQEENSNWYNMTLKASTSGILDPEELLEMKAQMTEAQFDQEMECSFTAAVLGTYYADLIQQLEVSGTIAPKAAVYNPNLPVHAVADIGFTDNTAFWFWQDADEGPQVILYYQNAGQPLDHYYEYLDGTGFEFETIWLPHDAVAKTLQTGRSTIEQFLAKGYPARIVPRLGRQDGIDAARLILPQCKIDYDKCYEGVEALRAYRRKYDEVLKQFRDTPLHDWASDGADSFRYFALVCDTHVKPAPPKSLVDRYKPDQYSLQQLFEDKEKPRNRIDKLRI